MELRKPHGTDCARLSLESQTTLIKTPIAYAVPRRGRDGIWPLIVDRCPLCGQRHSHGGGNGDAPVFGCRAAHCMTTGAGSYRLVEVRK